MTIASALTALNQDIQDARTAITAKGGTVTVGGGSSQLATDIATISTVNNQDLTITSNGTYTAEAGYTGLGTVTVNCPSADIVTATNNTGSNIALGDKVWLEKVSGGWNINSYSQSAVYQIGGSPTIDSSTHVISNFSSSAYIYRNQTIDFSKPWEYKTHIKTGTSVSGNQFLYAGGAASENGMNSSGMVIWFTNDSAVAQFFTGNNSSFTEICTRALIPVNVLAVNTEYYIKCGWTGTEYYGAYSTDGQTWIEIEQRFQSTTPCVQWGSQFVLGHLNWLNTMYFKGSIYLDDTSIFAGGKTVWKPYMYDIFETDNLFSGFANEAIANGASGEVKTVLPEEVTVTVTTDADNADITAE